MASDKAVQTLTMEDLIEINRAMGMIEGLVYCVGEDGVVEGMVEAIGRIDAVISGERRCEE